MWMTRVAIGHPVFATMVMVALCVLGLFSYARLGVEQLPDVSPPVVYVSVAWPGASPEAVETELTRPLEQALNSVAGVKMIRSNSWEGRSETVAEFQLDADVDRATQEVRDKVAQVQVQFPKEARQPYVARFDGDNAQPTVVLALLADGGAASGGQDAPPGGAAVAPRSARELALIAEQTVRRRLERVEGVARVTPSGLAKRQLRIDLDVQRLRALGLTPADVSAALARANRDEPVGLLGDAQRDAVLRVEGRVRDPQRFAELVIARSATGSVVTLADVGRLVDREAEPDSISRVNGRPAVTFDVFKQQDANVVRTGDAILAAAEELRAALPPGVRLEKIYANSDWVKDSLAGVQRTLIEGALLTVVIVFLFLHSWRSTVITGLTLPIAVIATFLAVYAFGFTLNFMTMMALSLCIGLLIDDAIVVRENIVRHLAQGKDHRRAAEEGTREIGLAVMATTFAICAVFVPVAFMEGIVGKFFFPFGVTVTVAVLLSLFVSFTLDPMLSSVWPDPPSQRLRRLPGLRHAIDGVEAGMAGLHRSYDRLIGWAFGPQRWRLPLPAWGRPFGADGRRDPRQPRRWRAATLTPRGVVLGVAALSLLGALALAPLIGAETMPQTDQGYTQLVVRLPVGSSLERSDAKIREVEARVLALPEVRSLTTRIGGDQGRHQATLGIGLTPLAERSRRQAEVEEAIRAALRPVPGIEIALGWNRPIYVAILGPDPAVLDRLTQDFAARVGQIPGITDLETSVKPGVPAWAVRLKPDAARELGLTAAQLAASLRAYVNGEVATYWTTPDGEQVEVQLRLPQAQRRSVAQLAGLPVAYAADGTPIALDRVAEIVSVDNPEVIKRQNLQRRQAVYAGVDVTSGRAVGDVGADVQKLVRATALPPGYRFDVGGQTQEQQEIFGAIVAALGLAVIFIYIVLASQFGSFVQPVALMASLPLSLIGVMLALLVTGSTINLFSMIGLIMLMGLVTKNAILLVDFANQARRAGAGVAEALRQAGQARMRPIVMTTMAMVFGMLPMALALNPGGEIQAPMGRAIIGGVITSTLLTLVVVPVIYSYLVRDAGRTGR
ncbi:MAG: efflux RND transporter permease subunit [Burkholderiaceae bacterium]|nr:efflux RND transporter permease subunit [Burkholderiaceae bacterium]